MTTACSKQQRQKAAIMAEFKLKTNNLSKTDITSAIRIDVNPVFRRIMEKNSSAFRLLARRLTDVLTDEEYRRRILVPYSSLV